MGKGAIRAGMYLIKHTWASYIPLLNLHCVHAGCVLITGEQKLQGWNWQFCHHFSLYSKCSQHFSANMGCWNLLILLQTSATKQLVSPTHNKGSRTDQKLVRDLLFDASNVGSNNCSI